MTTTFTATRDQLVDAISCIELRVPQSGPMARKISAESMADAIIEALGETKPDAGPVMRLYDCPLGHGPEMRPQPRCGASPVHCGCGEIMTEVSL